MPSTQAHKHTSYFNSSLKVIRFFLFILIIALGSSCNSSDDQSEINYEFNINENVASARNVTMSSPPPSCNWTNPNCQVCQLHDSNGLHVYFYCGECVIFIQADTDLALELYDNNTGNQLLGTLLDANIYSGNNYFEFYFDQGNPSGFAGDLRFVSRPFPGLGQQITSIHPYNCY